MNTPDEYPPLPLHEQIVRQKPMPAWWDKFTAQTEPIVVTPPPPPKKKYRYRMLPRKVYGYVAPENWTPYQERYGKNIKIGTQQRLILQKMEAEKDRWFSWKELKSLGRSGNLYQSIASLVNQDFLIAAPADDRHIKNRNGHYPHQWKYKFLHSAE